ncbi:MAG: peptidase domain-containing ABC transporter [Flavobacteriaceae bacterium]|nr:peptidase domain-containing ABC transporter [Flavobacteriaceae bacterium]
MNFKFIRKTFVEQHDVSDCGVACLLSVIQYHHGTNQLENLRRLSGTTKAGTSLLGLYQCAQTVGFDARGAEGSIEELLKQKEPVILHIETEEKQYHFVIYYGKRSDGTIMIGDPAKGIIHYTSQELKKRWQSKTCLLLTPNNHFVRKEFNKKEKRAWFLNLLMPDKRVLLFSLFIGVVVAVFTMGLSVFSQILVDDLLPSQQLVKLIGGLGLLLLILLVNVGLSGLREYFLIFQTRAFNLRIIDSFYSQLLHLPKMFFDTRKIGELVARLNDTQRIQNVIRTIVGNTIIEALIVLISFIFLFAYDLPSGMISAIITPLYFGLVYSFNKKIITAQRNVMQRYAYNESHYIASMQGMTTIQNTNQQTLFKLLNQQIYGAYQNEIFKLGKIGIRLSILSGIVGVVFLVSVISLASYHVLHENLELGVLFAIIGITSGLIPAINGLALISIPVNEAKIAFDRMYEFTSMEQENEKGKKIKTVQSISITKASFRFIGKKPLFTKVSIEAKKGEIIGVLGRSGSGKTTLGYVLQKHYELEDGEIRVNDQTPLNEMKLSSWRKKIGVVEQTPSIFNGTLIENVVLGRETDPEKIESFFKTYGFDSYFQRFPNGYLTLLGEEGINISGGQQHLVCFARALFSKPEVLILDEVTSSLDKTAEKFIFSVLKKIQKRTIVFFITHREYSLHGTADKIYRLE